MLIGLKKSLYILYEGCSVDYVSSAIKKGGGRAAIMVLQRFAIQLVYSRDRYLEI